MIRKIIDFLLRLFGLNKPEENVSPSVDTEQNIGENDTTDVSEADDDDEPTTDISDSGTTEIELPDSGETEVIETPPAHKSKIKILVDNGHGNNTAGKRSPWSSHKVPPEIDFYEYKWNREISHKLVDELRKLGYDADLIVTEEYDVSLEERVRRVNAVCEQYGASNVILISVHANAAGHGDKWMTGRGWCAYTSKGNTKSDDLAEFLYRAAAENFPGMKLRADKSDGDSDQEANFYIIYRTYCTAVLTENFFYDNVDDVKYILSDEGKLAVIKTHVDGIVNYIKYLNK